MSYFLTLSLRGWSPHTHTHFVITTGTRGEVKGEEGASGGRRQGAEEEADCGMGLSGGQRVLGDQLTLGDSVL